MRSRSRMAVGVVGALLMVGLALTVLLTPHYRITDSAMAGMANPGAEVYLAKRDNYAPGHLVTLQYGGDVFTRSLLGYQPDGMLVIGDASNKPEVHPGPDGKPVALSSANIIGEVVLMVPHGREVTIAVFFCAVDYGRLVLPVGRQFRRPAIVMGYQRPRYLPPLIGTANIPAGSDRRGRLLFVASKYRQRATGIW